MADNNTTQLSQQRIAELKKAGAFQPGGRKLLQQRFGYTPERANEIFFANAPELKVYGRRSAGIGKQEIATIGEVGRQYLEPVIVTDTNKGATTRRYSTTTGQVTSVRQEEIPSKQAYIPGITPAIRTINKYIQPFTKGQITGSAVQNVQVVDEQGNTIRTERVLVPTYQTPQAQFLQNLKLKYLGENYQKVLPYRRFLRGDTGVGNLYAEDVVLLGAGSAAAGGISAGLSMPSFATISPRVRYGTSIVFSKPITDFSDRITGLWTPKTQVGKFTKGVTTGVVTVARLPSLGLAYGTQFAKGLFLSPTETLSGAKQFAFENPAEFTGLIAGGSGRLRSEAERLGRKVTGSREFKVEVMKTSAGDIKIVDTGKYGKIAYVEGQFAQSEKIARARQLAKSKGVNRVVFTQASAEAIPLTRQGRGAGFEVIAGKPLRGFYEAPPFDFLQQLGRQVQGARSGILTFYLESQSRSLLGNPLQGIKDVLTGKADLGTKRPAVALRRASYPKTDAWVYETSSSLERAGTIPKKYSTIIDKYYKKFLAEPFTDSFLGGKVLTGQAKLDHINRINLKGQGSGNKLKFYAALLQFQKDVRGKQLVGGAEVLSTITPYGAESQIVTGLGTRYYRRSLKDLRKAKPVNLLERTVEKVTGVKRGQAFALINGNLIEFDFFRAGRKVDTPRKIKVTKQQPVTSLKEDLSIDLIPVTRRSPTTRYRVPATPSVRTRSQIDTSIPNILTRSSERVMERAGGRTTQRRGAIQRVDARARTRPSRTRPTTPRVEEVLLRPRIEPRRIRQPRAPRRMPPRPPIINVIRPIQPRDTPRSPRRKIRSRTPSRQRAYVLTANIGNVLTGEKRGRVKLSSLTGFETLTI